MIALLAPGQGSQTSGMLTSWLGLPGTDPAASDAPIAGDDADIAAAREQIAGWSKLIGLDLQALGTTATAEAITDTAVTQPLVVAATLLAHTRMMRRGLLSGNQMIVAGHSVGEIAAYAIAGVISADDAIMLAATRGREMARACAIEATGMAAVLGGDAAEVLARLEQLDLVAANRNAVGQIVAAGPVTALEKLIEDPPAKARVRKLATAGAFHTEYMSPAMAAYAAAAAELRVTDPTATLLSNLDGKPVTSGAVAMRQLVAQMTRPVRWDLCMETIRGRNVTSTVELPPAGTLTGIAKRELRGTPAHAVTSPADLDGMVAN